MSHQTGIQANAELRKFFGKCREGSVRVLKVAIVDEQLTLVDEKPPKDNWERDYDSLVLPLLERGQPCYLFYRLDTTCPNGYDWVFISWSPDDSPVRQKMLYASTKATLKKEFGGGNITHELFGTTRDEMRLHGVRKVVLASGEHETSPAPLTQAEKELRHIRLGEAAATGMDVRHQTLRGLQFPISDDAVAALFDLKSASISYVQLSIDAAREEINLEVRENITVESLSERIPRDHPRYHLFLFPHKHQGEKFKSIVFIYSIAGSECPVKERMLYSSCKLPLVETIETQVGVPITKKVEIDEPSELNEAFLIDQLHPKQNICKQKFAKPKGPTNRGARRLIRTQPEN